MTKNQIRQKLIKEHGFTNIVLDNYTKKQELINLLAQNGGSEKKLTEDKSEQPEEQKDLTPNSPEWTQHVLSHFEDDELEGKNPKVDGLRRIVGLLLGTIVEEGCNLISAPNETNEMRACVKAWIVIKSKENLTIRYEALADAYGGNCTEKFNMYITALADTRAKGRCFRNALKLKQVIAAEESQMSIGDAYAPNTGKIDQGQITAINLMCKRNSLDLKIILDSIELQYKFDDGGNIDLFELSNANGREILQEINRINTTKDKKE